MEPPDEPWLNVVLIVLPLLLLIVFWTILFVVDQPEHGSPRAANRKKRRGDEGEEMSRETRLVIERMARTDREREVRQLGEHISFSEKDGRERSEEDARKEREGNMALLELVVVSRINNLIDYNTTHQDSRIEVLRRAINGSIHDLSTRIENIRETVIETIRRKINEQAYHVRHVVHDGINSDLDRLQRNAELQKEHLDVVFRRTKENRDRLASLEGFRELLHGVIREGFELWREENELSVEGWMDVLREIGEEVRRLAAEVEGEEDETSNQDDEDEEHGNDEEEDGAYWGGGEPRKQDTYGYYNGSGDEEEPGQDQEYREEQRYEHWNWDDHDEHGTEELNRDDYEGHDVIDDAYKLLAGMEEVRRFLAVSRELDDALRTEPGPPPPTREDSPMPFTNGFFVPNPPEATRPRERTTHGANRAHGPTVEDAVEISQDENVSVSTASEKIRPEYYVDAAEFAALKNTYRGRSDDDSIGNKYKDK